MASATATGQAKWLPSVEVARERYPHGTRGRYCFGKCRCARCRDAQRKYNARINDRRKKKPYRMRHIAPVAEWRIYRRSDAKQVFASTDKTLAYRKLESLNAGAVNDPLELVSADPAREHIAWLQSQGVGMKTIAKAAPMSYSVLCRIATGDIARVRRVNLAKLLAVKPQVIREGARVRSDASVVLIERLVAAGYRRGWIAEKLGSSRRALQIGKTAFISVRNARAIRELYVRTASADEGLPQLGAFQLQLDVPEPTHLRSGRGSQPAVSPAKTARHGTRARYAEFGCRCKPCTAANDEYQRAAGATRQVRFALLARADGWDVLDRRQSNVVFSSSDRDAAAAVAEAFNMRDPIAGPHTLVDAEPVRKHVRDLLESGLAIADVAAAAGVRVHSVWYLVNKANKRLTNRVATALRSVDVGEARPSTARVDAAPTWALLDRLDAGGFHIEWVADVLQIGRATLKNRPARIRLDDARAVRALYADVRERVAIVRTLEASVGT